MTDLYLLLGYIALSFFFLLIALRRQSVIATGQNLTARGFFFVVPIMVLAITLIAFRPFLSGGDTQVYLVAFERLYSPFSAVSDARYGTEILFWPTQAVIKFFFDSRGWLVTNFLVVTLLVFFSYKTVLRDTAISALIFAAVYLTFYGIYCGNTMRQAYAMPLGLIAFFYLYHKSYAKGLLFSALAISFHWSAVILVLTPVMLLVPNKMSYYLCVPAACLFSSFIARGVIEAIVGVLEFDWVASKVHLYVEGGRISHIDAVWKTANFWLCTGVYLAFVLLKGFESAAGKVVSKYVLLFFSLMLFCIFFADVSERYMVWLMLVVPILVSIVLLSTKFSHFTRNAIFLAAFFLLSVLVYTRESAIITLGIDL